MFEIKVDAHYCCSNLHNPQRCQVPGVREKQGLGAGEEQAPALRTCEKIKQLTPSRQVAKTHKGEWLFSFAPLREMLLLFGRFFYTFSLPGPPLSPVISHLLLSPAHHWSMSLASQAPDT
jgi:hypothetical protein